MTDRWASTRELTKLLKPACHACADYGYTHYDSRGRPVPCRVCQPKLAHPSSIAAASTYTSPISVCSVVRGEGEREGKEGGL